MPPPAAGARSTAAQRPWGPTRARLDASSARQPLPKRTEVLPARSRLRGRGCTSEGLGEVQALAGRQGFGDDAARADVRAGGARRDARARRGDPGAAGRTTSAPRPPRAPWPTPSRWPAPRRSAPAATTSSRSTSRPGSPASTRDIVIVNDGALRRRRTARSTPARSSTASRSSRASRFGTDPDLANGTRGAGRRGRLGQPGRRLELHGRRQPGRAASWVMFASDGLPHRFTENAAPRRPATTLGPIGEAGGAIYVTNGKRDYAVVLSPLGTVRAAPLASRTQEPGRNERATSRAVPRATRARLHAGRGDDHAR